MNIYDAAKAAVTPMFAETAHGVAITYTPDVSLGIDPFPCTGIPGRVDLMDPSGQGVVDSSSIKVLHSDLAAAGMDAPVPRGGGKVGDSITKKNLNGDIETWTVIDADPSPAGYWVLAIEQVQRLNPQ